MNQSIERRHFLSQSGRAVVVGAAAASFVVGARGRVGASLPEQSTGENRGRIFKSIKFQMLQEKLSIEEKFKLLLDLGYDGVELNSPNGENKEEALAASVKVGLPIHGVVDTVHWRIKLSSADAAERKKGLDALLKAIEETYAVHGSAVLLVPGVVGGDVTQDECWHRSIAEIRKALPSAAKHGVHILIENVWNRFLYDHDGSSDQTADLLAHYLDTINSPWVGSYFDIGNHQKYGSPAHWIRRLGRRVVKLDVKDWGRAAGWAKIGDGDVDWEDVRRALASIGFTGWCTAEVGGGDRKRIAEIADRMNRALGL